MCIKCILAFFTSAGSEELCESFIVTHPREQVVGGIIENVAILQILGGPPQHGSRRIEAQHENHEIKKRHSSINFGQTHEHDGDPNHSHGHPIEDGHGSLFGAYYHRHDHSHHHTHGDGGYGHIPLPITCAGKTKKKKLQIFYHSFQH